MISITHYSPGPCYYNPELFQENDSNDSIQLGVNSRLKCSAGVDQFGIQFVIIILRQSDTFLKVGLLFGIKMDGFGQIIESDPTLKDHKADLEEICKIAWNAVIGAVAAQTVIAPDKFPSIDKDALIRSGVILPPIPYGTLANDIDIICRPSSEK